MSATAGQRPQKTTPSRESIRRMQWFLCLATVFLAFIHGAASYDDDPTYMQCTEWPDRGPCNGTLYRDECRMQCFGKEAHEKGR
ncbi:hypothetical protein MRX96_034965 [Rhipicephalus microplus]